MFYPLIKDTKEFTLILEKLISSLGRTKATKKSFKNRSKNHSKIRGEFTRGNFLGGGGDSPEGNPPGGGGGFVGGGGGLLFEQISA